MIKHNVHIFGVTRFSNDKTILKQQLKMTEL